MAGNRYDIGAPCILIFRWIEVRLGRLKRATTGVRLFGVSGKTWAGPSTFARPRQRDRLRYARLFNATSTGPAS